MTRIFIFQLNTCGYGPYVTSSLTRGWVCRLQLLLGVASAVILRSESRGTHGHILLSQIRDSPNPEGHVPAFISPRNRLARLYPQALNSLSVASYDSQGYGGGIRPRLHTGLSNFWFWVLVLYYDQIFLLSWQLRVCWFGAPFLTRGRVCRLQLLLVPASTAILGYESRGTRNHILLSQIQDFSFRRHLRLTGLRWRYSTPPPYGILCLTSESDSQGYGGGIRPRLHTGYMNINKICTYLYCDALVCNGR
jgi:hypothetical protein